MNKRMGQLVVALVLFAIAVILCYFSIVEKTEGKPVQDADIMLVLDVSGSMGDQGTTGKIKIEEAKYAADEFLDTIGSGLNVGLVSFESSDHLVSPLTTNMSTIKNAINGLSPGGYTAMGDGIGTAAEELVSKGNPNAKKYIVLMTDGHSNIEKKYTPKQAKDYAVKEGVIVYSVGFGKSADEALLRQISNATGGKYYFAATGSDLVQKFQKVAIDIVERKPVYYYGSRALLFVAVILIIFLPEIVQRTRMTLLRERDKPIKTRSYGGEER